MNEDDPYVVGRITQLTITEKVRDIPNKATITDEKLLRRIEDLEKRMKKLERAFHYE